MVAMEQMVPWVDRVSAVSTAEEVSRVLKDSKEWPASPVMVVVTHRGLKAIEESLDYLEEEVWWEEKVLEVPLVIKERREDRLIKEVICPKGIYNKFLNLLGYCW